MKRQGFTLVELSIVLVIIGLLIGGILVAQSMINTAKIQALVRQVGQFDAAVENFQTKYQQLPGDTNLMGQFPGDNNGIITDLPGGSGSNTYFYGEIGKFWSDLSKSGLTKSGSGSYIDMGSYQGYPDFNYMPQAQAGTNASVIALGSPISLRNYYLITKRDVAQAFVLQGLTGALKVSEILAIDTKMDDGLANSGNVQGWGGGDTGNNGTTTDDLETPTGNANCATGGAYSINATYLCGARIRMGATTGNPK